MRRALHLLRWPSFVFLLLFAALGLRALDTYLTLGEARRYWLEPRGAPGGLKHVALGDSLAQGVGASTPEKGFVGLVSSNLRIETGQPVQTVNISRSGAKIQELVDNQLPRLAGLQPDVVTASIGGNDVMDYDPAAWARNVETLCRALAPYNSVVADVPDFGHGDGERRAAEARQVLRETCERYDVPVARSAEDFKNAGWLGMFTMYAGDWFHYSDGGYELLARSVTDELLPQLDPKALRPIRY